MLFEFLKSRRGLRKSLDEEKSGGEIPNFSQPCNFDHMRGLIQQKLPELHALSDFFESSTRPVGRCNRTAAEFAITNLYRFHGHKPPAFVWFDAPSEGLIAIALYDVMKTIVGKKDSSFEIETKFSLSRQFVFSFPVQKSEHERKLYSDIAAAMHTPPFAKRQWWETYNGVVERSAIAHTNEALKYGNVEKLLAVCASVQQQLSLNHALLSKWDKLATDISSFSETRYLEEVTSRRHFVRSGGCLIHKEGFDVYNLVTPRTLYNLLDCALLNAVAVPLPEGFVEARDALINCGWWYPLRELCIMIDRPLELHMDENELMHNERGLSIRYAGGWGVHCWHGITVPARVIDMQFTANDITHEPNVEVRRVMVERYGAERYLREAGGKPKQADRCGVLYRVAQQNDEPLVMVQVTNSTPEPDGSFKKYFLRVPPQMRTAREAVAWTFGLPPGEYSPLAES